MEQVNIVLDTMRSFVIQMGEFLPKFIAAIIILVAGWLFAKAMLYAVVRGLKIVNFGTLTERAGIDKFLKHGGIRKTTIDILGILVYWLIILATLLVAFNTLGLTVVSDLVSRITQFIPNVIVAILILTIGLYFARFVSDSVIAYGKNVGLDDTEIMGRLTRYAIMVFVIIIALGQMNIGEAILYPAFLILFGGIVLALSLAFGLGGQKWAAGQLEKFFKKSGGRRK
ncbi:MAG: hypothetical protein BMS9Abin36_1229 [Gammaproteobacteria bacterium]|nr:MAG: hypothetical protein BMS9Abin36_1229 [Gammaproteobacteria bacterium]